MPGKRKTPKKKRYSDTETRLAVHRSDQKLRRELRDARKREKYGPRGKPAQVTVWRKNGKPETRDWPKARPQRPEESPLTAAVAAIGFESYGAYLRSAHWRDVRRRWVESGRRCRCTSCGAPEFQLHHKTYERLGGEELDDLKPLCSRCHKRLHRR